jgi:hypothetical protein
MWEMRLATRLQGASRHGKGVHTPHPVRAYVKLVTQDLLFATRILFEIDGLAVEMQLVVPCCSVGWSTSDDPINPVATPSLSGRLLLAHDTWLYIPIRGILRQAVTAPWVQTREG